MARFVAVATSWLMTAAAWRGSGIFCVIDQVPHAWLFPRCAAVVHHGGGGTTGAALASGRPQVVCPFWGDQPFWAQRAHAAGVAAAPQRGQRLTARGLTAAIAQVTTDPDLIATARSVGERARAENGVRTAVEVLERIGVPGARGR